MSWLTFFVVVAIGTSLLLLLLFSLVTRVYIFSYFAVALLLTLHPQQITETRRLELLDKYSLKTRRYIGPTSTDSELAQVMANLGQAAPGKIVLDPFVGTGSLLIAAAENGAHCIGSDFDYRVLHGFKKNEVKPGETIIETFQSYGLVVPDLLNADNSLPLWRDSFQVDSIITDPPYGVRAGARKSGSKKAKRPMKPTSVDKSYVSLLLSLLLSLRVSSLSFPLSLSLSLSLSFSHHPSLPSPPSLPPSLFHICVSYIPTHTPFLLATIAVKSKSTFPSLSRTRSKMSCTTLWTLLPRDSKLVDVLCICSPPQAGMSFFLCMHIYMRKKNSSHFCAFSSPSPFSFSFFAFSPPIPFFFFF